MRVIVIGGGVVGVTTAHELSAMGAEVVVVDRAAKDDGVATNVNAGLICPGHTLSWSNPAMLRRLPAVVTNRTPQIRVRSMDTALIRWGMGFVTNCTQAKARSSALLRGRLGVMSTDLTVALAKDLGMGNALKKGMIFVHETSTSLNAQFAAMRLLVDDGHDLAMLNAEEVLELEPSLRESPAPLAGAVYHGSGWTLDSREFSSRLRSTLESNGVQFVDGDVRSLTWETGLIKSVETERESIDGDCFVVAAGAHTPRILGKLSSRARIYPVRGYGLTWTDLPEDKGPRMGGLNETDLIAWSRHPSGLRVTGIAEFNRFTDSPNDDDVAGIIAKATKMFPVLAECAHPTIESGFRPMTPDGLPRIGKLTSNVYVNSGHGNLGWTLAAGSARILAGVIQGNPPDELAAAVAP